MAATRRSLEGLIALTATFYPWVIDGDGHIFEDAEAISSYLPSPYREAGPYPMTKLIPAVDHLHTQIGKLLPGAFLPSHGLPLALGSKPYWQPRGSRQGLMTRVLTGLMKETYDYWINEVVKQPPSLTADQFGDTLRALAPNNPRVKDVDLNKLIDASFVQNAVNKGLAAPK